VVTFRAVLIVVFAALIVVNFLRGHIYKRFRHPPRLKYLKPKQRLYAKRWTPFQGAQMIAGVKLLLSKEKNQRFLSPEHFAVIDFRCSEFPARCVILATMHLNTLHSTALRITHTVRTRRANTKRCSRVKKAIRVVGERESSRGDLLCSVMIAPNMAMDAG
jgi:hypothetical protein